MEIRTFAHNLTVVPVGPTYRYWETWNNFLDCNVKIDCLLSVSPNKCIACTLTLTANKGVICCHTCRCIWYSEKHLFFLCLNIYQH